MLLKRHLQYSTQTAKTQELKEKKISSSEFISVYVGSSMSGFYMWIVKLRKLCNLTNILYLKRKCSIAPTANLTDKGN